jgi:hypothetical protein
MLSSPFAVFVAALAFFHTSEAVLAFAYNRHDAGWHSACPRDAVRSSAAH